MHDGLASNEYFIAANYFMLMNRKKQSWTPSVEVIPAWRNEP